MGRLGRELQKLRERKGTTRNNTVESLDHETEVFLPLEITLDILRRLPLKSLSRFKCVCKLWCSSIEEPKFIKEHMNRSNLVYVYSRKTNIIPHAESAILCAKDGLLVEKSSWSKKYRIRNPATEKIIELPVPHGKRQHIKIFYLPTTHSYKLVYVHCREGTKNGGCQVLTVGNDPSWRTLDIPTFYDLGSEGNWSYCVDIGDVFFVTKLCHPGSSDSEVVCLEIESEQFVNIKIPQAFFSSWRNVRPVNWENKLSLARLVNEELHVWVLEDYKKQKWADRQEVLPLSSFLKKYPNMKSYPFPYERNSGWLWFYSQDGHHMAYDTKSQKVKVANYLPPGKKNLYCIRPSLVNLERTQPKEKPKEQRPKFEENQPKEKPMKQGSKFSLRWLQRIFGWGYDNEEFKS